MMNDYCKAILADPDEDSYNVKNFLHGACHVFALVLQRRFNKYAILVLTDLNDGGHHVYCRFSEGVLVDVVGVASEERALGELGLGGQAQKVLPADLQRYEKLCVAPSFLSVMEGRAERRIEKFIEYYSGKNGANDDIPGASRTDRASRAQIDALFSRD